MPTGTQQFPVPPEVLDARVVGPDSTVTLPTFQSADGARYVRFRTTASGVYQVTSVEGEAIGEVEVGAASTQAPAPYLARSGRRLVDQTGAPFLWMADTWWYALCDRLEPTELAALAAQRKGEGFSVVQVVAGLLPEIYAHDPLGDLAGTWPWNSDFSDLDPRWWDAADERIATIVSAGLVPAIAGAWSYYMVDMGRERLERHWREIVARWAALPVVWCIAGEAGLPHYDQISSPTIDAQVKELTTEWAKVTASVRAIDPYSNLRTIHPCPAFQHYSSTDLLEGNVEDLDLIWLQTGHADRSAISSSLDAIDREVGADHGLPVVNSEVCYEGIAAGSYETLQRFLFWSHLLSGAAGHTYGAQGIWAFRRAQDSNPGIAWGDTTWQEASTLPGGRQLGAAANYLRSFEWQDLEPAQDALSVHATPERREFPYAARAKDRVVAYFPAASLLPLGIGISLDMRETSVRDLAPGKWTFSWWNPRSGTEFESWDVLIDSSGEELLSSSRNFGSIPSMEDWVFTAKRAN